MSELHHSEMPALTAPPHPPRYLAWRQPALWLSAAALLVALVFGWQTGDRVEDTRAELARRLGDSDAMQKETQANAKQNREVLDALQARVGVLEAQLAEAQSQQLALEAMYQELSRSRDDRLIAEIEQAVSIAAQQLQLAGNVEAALIALTGAEARLAKNSQPQFLSLRKLIARDIERLKAMPAADVTGIAIKLDGVLNAVATLPLASDHRPVSVRNDKMTQPAHAAAAPAVPGWQAMLQGLLADLWQEVRQLVRIERIDRPDPGLLSPRETFFLRENLRLRLLAARLALLSRDGRSFRSDLRQAHEWLERYFDGLAPAVKEAQASLTALGRLDIMREPAELNETLSALRNFKLVRDRTSERTAR